MRTKVILSVMLFGVAVVLAGPIDLDNLFNYAEQGKPGYIVKDNTLGNQITDAGATLGRVLFYDKKLSVNNTTSCASCHLQQYAFGDTAILSEGANGETARHAMRLVNPRYGDVVRFFWDRRANTLEQQTTMPIRDHNELGYSGENGDPDFDELLVKLNDTEYYPVLTQLAFGEEVLTEDHMQLALAQFMRSIQSFDSDFDLGRAQAPNDRARFFNESMQEHRGKMLFLNPTQFNAQGERIGGGFGCAGCHVPPEFSSDPRMLSNGVVVDAHDDGSKTLIDSDVTRSPSLRDLFNPQGELNGPFFHTGHAATLNDVFDHYNDVGASIPEGFDVTPIDPRVLPGGIPQKLNMTQTDREDVVAFLRTLTSSDVYTNEKWSTPFDDQGNITLISGPISVPSVTETDIQVYPNPVQDVAVIQGSDHLYGVVVYSMLGEIATSQVSQLPITSLNVADIASGTYIAVFQDQAGTPIGSVKLIKE